MKFARRRNDMHRSIGWEAGKKTVRKLQRVLTEGNERRIRLTDALRNVRLEFRDDFTEDDRPFVIDVLRRIVPGFNVCITAHVEPKLVRVPGQKNFMRMVGKKM